ncbi:serine protease inhibitor swm-1-like [Musca autumnalis]|uniref:serine protease inhibitor swm-1-like n=1 Tax=Musca autumnalis TaxID=221902 RepID=UPI003CF65E00
MAKISKQLLILFAILAMFAAQGFSAPNSQRCGRNEQYTTCGTACPLTCAKRQPGICTLQCVIGCQCRQGYLRNNRGACVRPQDCYFRARDSKLLTMAKVFKQLMLLFAVLALIVAQGFAAPPSKECGENEEYVTCGTACPLTCTKQSPGVCTLQCVVGCQCKDGYVLNDEKECVLTKNC